MKTRDVRATASSASADPDITLTMSGEVARTLRSLIGVVGGSKPSSYRQDTDEIYAALDAANVRPVGARFIGNVTALDVP